MQRFEGVEGARLAYAAAKARGAHEEAQKIKDFILEMKRLGLLNGADSLLRV